MTLALFDTLTRQKATLAPIDGKVFRFYCCGPTVYGPAHIGNFRTFVLQDIFRRVLELGGTTTRHVRNITDVDDKTIRDSLKAGQSLRDFTNHWLGKFHADCRALNCLPPHVEPGAVDHIPQQIAMIATLMERGHAYKAADGSVYFRVSSFPQYGRLSRLKERELRMGTSVSDDEYERDTLADFALWKARKPEDGENFWPSPWGEGRPGWHLECSAMTREYLGDTFDLHSGGVDLVFPHHENEIAQSECCSGHEFCRHWFHITHLLVDHAKMSKSLGNLYTLDDLAAKGFSPMEVRYVLSAAHYRAPLNFTLASLEAARPALARLARAEQALASRAGLNAPAYADLPSHGPGPFAAAWDSLNDDLNTAEALGHIFVTLRSLPADSLSTQDAAAAFLGLHFMLAAFGLILPPTSLQQDDIPEEILRLASQRWDARLARDWATSDLLRAELDALGWIMKDGKTSWELTRK
ncbi:MAG: cysteine--tRNA ligase [Verrucomicrobiota bacterium]|jgi:cysteinyl-tRNA synthetase